MLQGACRVIKKNMQTHDCQHNITQPYGWFYLYIQHMAGVHRLTFMGRDLYGLKKLIMVWKV
jgi:hypothetical protein